MYSQLICLNLLLLHGLLGFAMHLKAARKHSSLLPRSVDLTPRIDGHTLLFAEDIPNSDYRPSFAAQVSLKPKLPTVILDDWTTQFKTIACTGSKMLLVLDHQEVFEHVERGWEPFDEFIIITSDPGCASDGHHTAFTSTLSSVDKTMKSVLLDVVPRDLEDVNHRVRVEYGNHLAQRLAPRLIGRQASSSPSTASSITAIPTITATSAPVSTAPSVSTSISYPEPKSVSNNTTATDKFDFSRTDTTLLPPDPLIAALVPQIDVPGLKLKCLNCTASGSITVTAATFDVHYSSTTLGRFQDFFLDDGYLRLSVDQMKAHVEMGLDLLPGFPFISVAPALPDIPIYGITIAGVLKLGLFLSPVFPAAIRLNSEVKMSTGFTLTVPNNSTITLNVTDPYGVSSKGFDGTELKALPFNISQKDLSFNFTSSFQPLLKLSARTAVGNSASAKGGIGIVMDLPSYNAEVRTVRNATNKCEAATDGSGAEYINVIPSVGIDAKAVAELAVSYMNISAEIGVVQPIFQLSKPLPTACYLWSSQSRGVAVASATSTSTSTPTGAASAPGTVSHAVAGLSIVAAVISLLF